MKVKVITEFVDKYAKELHEIGSTFDCTKERFDEIQESGEYVTPVTVTTKETKEKE